MLFNISNHPANTEKTTWSPEQKAAATKLFGDGIVDCGFPECTPNMSDEQLRNIAHEVARDCAGMAGDARYALTEEKCGAMVAGHYIMVTYLVAELQKQGIACYVGDSVRVAEEVEQEDGSIAVVHKFQFAGFRKYPTILVGLMYEKA